MVFCLTWIIGKKQLAAISISLLLCVFVISLGLYTISETTLGESINWGLSFPKEGASPDGPVPADTLKKYDAYYIHNTEKKVIYLTFDAGYECGYALPMLDTLKKHSVKAAFFIVGNYIETSPDIVKRMLEEGHIVGNHTFSHPDMSNIRQFDLFQKEVTALDELFKYITGQDMKKYYRPPRGKYNENNLKFAQKIGYKTIFWSLAYVDWLKNNQPSHEEAFKKLVPRIHPGAIVLLHLTSKTNMEILDELIGKWKDMGYSFGSLDEIT
jgi:peptidoglycan-N-acetylmuramic acid deacetylase